MRVPVSTHVRRNVGGNIVADASFHIYERGTETHVTVYTSETGAGTVSQPLTSDSEGRFPDKWIDAGSYDHLVTTPQDQVGIPQEAEAAPGWPFSDEGFRVGRHIARSDDLPGPGDVVLGNIPEPGSDDNRGRWASRVGIFHRGEEIRTDIGAALNIPEANDPAELRLRRYPAINVQRPTGGEPVFRKYPVGGSTQLAADVAMSASEFYVITHDTLPTEWDSTFPDVEFMVDDLAVTYTARAQIKDFVCGDHAIGATTIKVGEAETQFPSAGRAFGRGIQIAWTGKSTILSATADGDHRAGSTTLTLVGDLSQISSEGSVRVITVGGLVRRYKYSSVAGQVLTLSNESPLTRNVPSGNAVTMHSLTGVTSDFETTAFGAHAAGATTLGLQYDFGDDTATAQAHADGWDALPSSGTLRYESLVTPSGPGLVDYPVERVSYSALTTASVDGGKVSMSMTVSALPAVCPHNSWVMVEGYPGVSRELPNDRTLSMSKVTGAAGFTSAKSHGVVAEFSPRYRNPLPAASGLGFIAGDPHSPSGYTTQSALISFTLTEDATQAKDRGGQITHTLTSEISGDRKQLIFELPRGVGINLREAANIAHLLHVGGPRTRAQEAAEEDHDSDEETPPIVPANLSSGTLTVKNTEGFLSAARLKIEVHNADIGANEFRDFDYTGLGAGKLTFTGVTYDGTDGYTIDDFVVEAGTEIKLADSVEHQPLGVAGNILAAKSNSNGEAILGIIGPAAQPGVRMGDLEIYERSDDRLGIGASDILLPAASLNLSGTHAARPAAGTAGRTYFETDTHVLYRDSGTVWQAQGPGYIYKTADETVNNSSTLQDDNELFFPIENGETWLVEAILRCDGDSTTADWKFGWNLPGGVTINRWGAIGQAWSAVPVASTPTVLVGGAGTVTAGGMNDESGVILVARISAPSGAGTVTLQWVQNTATVENNTIKAGSLLRLTRLV